VGRRRQWGHAAIECAFEDAAVLVEELAGSESVASALDSYERRRRPRVETIQELATTQVQQMGTQRAQITEALDSFGQSTSF
jgi:2-polyprenyl-6-methoxyphenol hydroxylase-like FAD-dependent oxidoreductase